MLGGNDMNVFGAATQGKNVEKKNSGRNIPGRSRITFHRPNLESPNAPKLYRAILDGIEYRGTAFLQCFTTCQPEHGVADDMALTQAQRVRDSRGAPEFFSTALGETYQESLDLKGNPSNGEGLVRNGSSRLPNEPYRYTVAHWCARKRASGTI